jgi:N-acetylneuraminic acid mutarotase/plastocyanin
MKKSLIAITISLFSLAGCQTSGPVTPTATPAPTTPPPSATPVPVFAGETVLKGSIALDALSVIVEAATVDGSFRKAVETTTKSYMIGSVPVGKQVRVQAQYKNNPRVILSARMDIAPEQKEKETTLNITLESTVTDLILTKAAELNAAAVSALSVAQLESNSQLTAHRQAVLDVLTGIMKTPIDAQVQPLQTHPDLAKKLNEVLPQMQAALGGEPVATPSGTPSAVPTATPTPTTSSAPTAFSPSKILLKPGNNVTIAKDTSLKLWVVGIDETTNEQRTITPIWVLGNNSADATLTASGVFTPQKAGTYTYTANFGNLSQTVTITVTDSELNSLELVPDTNLTLDSGRPFELKAKGKDKFGNEVTVSPSWELSNNFVGTVDENGVFLGNQAGRVDITARARSFSATTTLTVQSASSFFIEMSPATPVILTGKEQPFQVLAQDLATNVSSFAFNFSVLDTSIGQFVSQDSSISGINPTAVFRALKPGTTEIRVRDILSNVTTTLPVTVADNVPYLSSFSPAVPLVPGQTITLSGENFSTSPSENQVFFNRVQASVLTATPTQLVVTVPIGAFSGYVYVTSGGRKGNGIPFVISPKLENIIPQEGAEGSLVTLTGQYFSTDNPAHNAVFFGSQKASIPLNVTGSSMQVIVPSNLGSEVDVSVRVKGQLSDFRKFNVSGANIPNWDERQPAITSRSGAMAEAISGKVYVIGGSQSDRSDKLEAYDVTANTWSILSPLPSNRADVATTVLDDRLFVIGGSGESSRLDRYDPATNTWLNLQSMTTGRFGATAETFRGKIYVIGGNGSNGRVVEEYNPDSNKWVTKRTSPSRRYLAASAVFNGKIYIIGGGETAEDRVNAYDVDKDEWITALAPMPKPVTKAQAVLINSKIYVIGGENQNGQKQDSVYEYDPASDKWRTLKRLPSVRSGAAIAAYGSRIYTIGGFDSNNTTVTTLFRGTL